MQICSAKKSPQSQDWSTMRVVSRVGGATAILFALAGCAVPTHTEAISGGSLSPKKICQGSFSSAVLLDWAPATVAVFRKYQYGGPKNHVPFAHVFPTVPGSAQGAWCGTKAGSDATHWWAVVVGQKPATLWISAPDGVRHGLVSEPPQVP